MNADGTPTPWDLCDAAWATGSTPSEKYAAVRQLASEHVLLGRPGIWCSHEDDGDFVVARCKMAPDLLFPGDGNMVVVYAPNGTRRSGWANIEGRLELVGDRKVWKGQKT